jgi:hypothetical protein
MKPKIHIASQRESENDSAWGRSMYLMYVVLKKGKMKKKK